MQVGRTDDGTLDSNDSQTDDGNATMSIDFRFNVYGIPYTSLVLVSNNGLITFYDGLGNVSDLEPFQADWPVPEWWSGQMSDGTGQFHGTYMASLQRH